MRIAYLDCFSGISGDMFLGALVDAGVSPQLLEETVAALNLAARLEISRVNRSGISATKVDVYAGGEKDLPREAYWEQQNRGLSRHSHEQGHQHHHEHGHEGEPVELLEHNYPLQSEHSSRTGASAPHSHSHDHGRGLTEIREIIRKAGDQRIREDHCDRDFRGLGRRLRPRFTTLTSRAFTFMKSARLMPWWTSSARRWGRRRWALMKLSALR